MEIIDITGTIQDGMWNYEAPFPRFSLKKLPKVEWLEQDVFCEVFEGLHSQTGTYLETPAHYYGNDKHELIHDLPLEHLVNMNGVVVQVRKDFGRRERVPIEIEDIMAAFDQVRTREGDAILIGTGWGKHWMDEFYLNSSPYFSYDAIKWLIDKKPRLLGTDFPRWENLEKWQGFFPEFYSRDILMLAPCVNLEKAGAARIELTALPLNIKGTSCVPCRAFIRVKEGVRQEMLHD